MSDFNPSRFEILAYTGGKLNVDGYDLPVVVDLSGLEADTTIPIVVKHDTSDDMVLGQVTPDGIDNDGQRLFLSGLITADPELSPSVKRIIAMSGKGHNWQASIGAAVEETRDVPPGEVVNVNGQQIEGPFTLAVRSVLRETSVLGMGADKNTTVTLAAKALLNLRADFMDETTDFESWIKDTLKQDPGSLSELARSALAKAYAAENSDKADPVDAEGDDAEHKEPDGDEVSAEGDADSDSDVAADGDEPDGDEPQEKEKAVAASNKKLPIEAKGGDGASLDSKILRQRQQYAAETKRIAAIEAKCGGDKMLCAKAIAAGWSVEKAELEYLRRSSRQQAPYGHVKNESRTDTIQALQGGLILRAGGKIDHAGYGGEMGLALGLPSWLRAGVNADQRQKAMEAAWKYRDLSLPDLCKIAAELDGGRSPHIDGSKQGFIRAAVSGGTVADIFSTNMNALLIQKLLESGDSTAGWTRESDAANFQTMERTRLTKGPRLSLHGRGGSADNATRSDIMESYRINRYSQQFKIDEQDIIDDRFNALQDIPNEMGLACARVRPDLVYSIVMGNPTLSATSAALFSASQPGSQSNLVASGGSLTSATLQAGMAAMFNFLENGIGLNLYPTHILVPMGLAGTAFNLLQGQNIALAGTSGSVTEKGDLNPLAALQSKFGKIEVVTDQRLTNGVTDPASGTSYSGSSTTWRLVSNMVPTIEVAYLRGAGRAPQVRQYMLDKGEWGIGWDVNLDIGAKALEWRGFYEARA